MPAEGSLPDEETVRGALQTFVGTFDQRPPAFSARKAGGRVAHRAARAGHPIDLPARTVVIDSLALLSYERETDAVDVRVDLRCGPGTYVRSLARDLGERLGCGGYLSALRRTEAAGLSVADAVTPDRLEALASDGRLSDVLLPVGSLLPLPRVALDRSQANAFVHGSAQPFAGAPDGRAAVFESESLLGIGVVAGGILRPEKVLPPEGVA